MEAAAEELVVVVVVVVVTALVVTPDAALVDVVLTLAVFELELVETDDVLAVVVGLHVVTVVADDTSAAIAYEGSATTADAEKVPDFR